MEYGNYGDELAQTKFVWKLKPGTNLINATLHGIVGTVELSIANPYYVTGQTAKQEVTVTALDNGGAIIVGPDAYDRPIVVKNSDRSGSTKLSQTKLTSPADRLYITYSGNGCGHATLTADSARATFEPELVSGATYAIPSRRVVSGSNMVLGNDGAVWFMESRAIGRVTTTGRINEYPVASTSNDPNELAAGPDGHVWFATGYGTAPSPSASAAAVERVNDDGTISAFPLPTPPSKQSYYPAQIIAGPQSDLWISYGGAIYSLTSGGTYSVQYKGDGYGRFDGMAEGPDGNIWMSGFTSSGDHKFKLVPGGAPVILTGPTANIRAGSFVNAQDTLYLLGLSTAAVVGETGNLVQRFAIPGTYPEGAPSVGGGSIWIPMPSSKRGYPSVGRIRLSDNATCSYVLPILDGKKGVPLNSLAVGSDGKLWFAGGHFVGKAPIPAI